MDVQGNNDRSWMAVVVVEIGLMVEDYDDEYAVYKT